MGEEDAGKGGGQRADRPVPGAQIGTGGDVAVLIPAAGAGTRMGGAPKQFRLLGGAPVLVQTLRAFARHRAVGPLVVAVPEPETGRVASLLAAHGVAALVVAGGASRQASVGRALAAVADAVGVVLVHDAVRPFVPAEKITAVVEACRSDGAAALAVPVADTLRRAEGGWFGGTVEREGLYRMQTPQGARAGWLRAAFASAERDAFEATDEVALLQHAGFDVLLVPGDGRNVKLTHPEDWALAEALWPAWQRAEAGGSEVGGASR